MSFLPRPLIGKMDGKPTGTLRTVISQPALTLIQLFQKLTCRYSMQAMAIATMVLNACEQHGPAVAFVADTVCSKSTPYARPTVTIICESPFGGLETAQ